VKRIVQGLSRRALIAFAAALIAAPVLAAPTWSPSPAQVALLTQGRVFIEVIGEADNRHGVIHAAIDIPATRDIVWQVMTDCAATPRLIRNATCRVVSGDMRRGSDVREQQMAGNLIFPSMRNQVQTDYEPTSRMRFHRTGGDFRTLEGEWRLEPINGGAGTRVIYINRLAVNVSLPAPMMREGMRRDVPKMLLNLRRESLAAAR
jgi:hypothetical protein